MSDVTIKAVKPQTFAEQLLAVLPSHSHICPSGLTWEATWTTSHGVWKVSHSNVAILTGTEISGPGVLVKLANAEAATVIQVLRLHGAIEPPVTVVRRACGCSADLAAGQNVVCDRHQDVTNA